MRQPTPVDEASTHLHIPLQSPMQNVLEPSAERWSHGVRLPEISAPALLHDIFVEKANASSSAVAVEDSAGPVTYEELNAQAERLAAGLRGRGIGPGDLVALQLPRGRDVYMVLLGILKSGAAYVPLDPQWPVDRVTYILDDSQAALLITTSAFPNVQTSACPRCNIDAAWDDTLPVLASAPALDPTPDDVCYVIYTSGSTGRPKGVAISHRSAVHLVRAEQHLFAITSSDRVFAGFSIAFDAAVEEIWLAFAAGATLVVGTKEQMLGDLPTLLTDKRITVFSTVPTLLATVASDLPTVRLLILGGEAFPEALARRWVTPSRRVVNTYGPTEATVIATCSDVRADQPITLGRPIPNYDVYILDTAGQPVAPGEAGEICIAGIGLAQGYIGSQRALTAERFVTGPHGQRMYRSGDLGRYNPDGHIVFLGRRDDQVKVRGFRIELGEIEAALLAHPGVLQAAVAVRDLGTGVPDLVGYVVSHTHTTLDPEACKQALRQTMPAYCVPAHIEMLAVMPTLASGKIDRSQLPTPRRTQARRIDADALPRGAMEDMLARAWCELLSLPAVGRNENFFLDLGGHSLLAAQMVSRLRRLPQFAALSVYDVYEAPTVAGLAAKYNPSAAIDAVPAPAAAAKQVSRWRYYACGVAQLFGLYGISGVCSAELLAPYLTYAILRANEVDVMPSLLGGAGLLLAAYPLMLLAAVLIKWMVIGRYKAGTYPLWGAYYFRFWLVERVFSVVPTWFLHGTPLLNAYYRLLGARVGKNVHLAAASLACFDLVHIDDDVSVGADVDMCGFSVQDGQLTLGHLHLGPRAVVGARSVLDPHTRIEADAILKELSRVPAGVHIPAGEVWAGSPATRVCLAPLRQPVARPTRLTFALHSLAYGLLVLLLPGMMVTAVLPGLVLLFYAEMHMGNWYLLVSPVVAALFVAVMCCEIVVIKWLFLGRVRAGRHAVFSGLFMRRWIFDQAMEMSLDVLGGLYATLYLNPWLRMLGVRLGKNVEVSTASGLTPDLLRIDDEAFIADCVAVGTPRIERGYVYLEPTHIGQRSFIGNCAVVPTGADIGDDCLLGCLSATPQTPRLGMASHQAWFGAPALQLPQRQVSAQFALETTYKPSRQLVLQRLCIEALRVTLPTTCAVGLISSLMTLAVWLHADMSHATFIALFPVLYMGLGMAAASIAVLVKWALMGRYRPGERPLWCTFIWRNELVTAMHENLADALFNELLKGTPFAPWFFRALGVKIGRRVYLETTQFTEYDLVSIGDDVCLNNDCTLQTHLFEDRVMKMSTIHIGEGCTIGRNAVVLYDTQMEPGAHLAALSLLMKGEALPAHSRWEGSPARRAVN